MTFIFMFKYANNLLPQSFIIYLHVHQIFIFMVWVFRTNINTNTITNINLKLLVNVFIENVLSLAYFLLFSPTLYLPSSHPHWKILTNRVFQTSEIISCGFSVVRPISVVWTSTLNFCTSDWFLFWQYRLWIVSLEQAAHQREHPFGLSFWTKIVSMCDDHGIWDELFKKMEKK